MKRSYLIFLLITFCFSCNNPGATNKDDKDTTAATHPAPALLTERQQLIAELKRIQSRLASKDKNEIAGIFRFPVADTTLGVYIDDKLAPEYEKNGNAITIEMFLKHYKRFSEQLDLNALEKLLANIPLDSLQHKDLLERQLNIKGEECKRYFKIENGNDVLRLESSMIGFAEKQKEEYDGCEYNAFWTFRFDGKKLHFVWHAAAG